MYDTNTLGVGDEGGAVTQCTFDEATGKLTIGKRDEMLGGEVKGIAFIHTKKPKVIAVGDGQQYYAKCLNNMGMAHGDIYGPQASLSCVAVNFTEKYSETIKLFMGSDNGQIFINVSEGGKQFDKPSRLIHTVAGGFITLMVFDDAGNKLYVTGSDKSIHIFNGDDGEKIASLADSHSKTIYDVNLFPAGSEALLATCSGDNTMKLWKANSDGTGLECTGTGTLGDG